MPKVACPPDKVYDKSKKKCVDIGGENYKNTLSKNPDAFKVYDKKISKFLSKGKTCKDGEAYYTPTKRCLKVGGQTYKMYMKKNPEGFDIKPRTMNKLLLTPVIEKVVISEKAKKLFMFKVSKFLRVIKNTKQENVNNQTSASNAFGLPKHILTTQTRSVKLPYILYLSAKPNINASSFDKKIKKKRFISTLNIQTDNFYDKVYRYALKSFTNPNIIDLKWFHEINEYYKKLDIPELFTIWSYTYHGDVYLNLWERGLKIDYTRIDMSVFLFEIINLLSMPSYTRDIFALKLEDSFDTNYTKFTNMTPQDIYNFWNVLSKTSSRRFKVSFINDLISRMSMRLSRIIRKAPATKETMMVYRGVKDSFFTADDFEKKMKINEVFVNKGFISTSLQPGVARSFSGDVCCFKVITILPGTKCLPLYGLSQFTEHEILLNKNTKYIIRDKYIAHVPIRPKNEYFNGVSSHRMKMTDIVIG